MGRRSDIDWEAVETAFRISQLSVRQIAEQHSTEASTITRRAKKHGWERDLSQAVAAATKTKVRNAVIRAAQQDAQQDAANTKIRNAVISVAQQAAANHVHSVFSEVDLAANVNATIILGQQKRAGKLSALLETMVKELQEVTSDPQSLEAIAMALNDADPASAKAVSQLRSISTRMNNLKMATEIMTKLNDAESSAFGITGSDVGASPVDGGIQVTFVRPSVAA